MNKILLFTLILIGFLFNSCKKIEQIPIHTYNTDPDYTWGYAEFFGPFYKADSNLNNVVSLSLFSDTLSINDDGELEGFGQYLFIEDVFCGPNDTIIKPGTYTASTSHQPFTFAPGEFFEVDDMKFRIGAYIYYIEKKATYSIIKNISRGSFTINKLGVNQLVTCDFVLSDSTKLQGRFRAELPYIDQSKTALQGAARKKLKLDKEIE